MEKSDVGLIGSREIQKEIKRRHLIKSPPSLAGIKRWLKQAGSAGTPESPADAAYYPSLRRTDDPAILSCDWIARYLKGGEKVCAFHTINLRTHALAQTIRADKSTSSACEHVLEAFSTLGLPDFLQIDNDAAFTGLGRTKPVLGASFVCCCTWAPKSFSSRPVNPNATIRSSAPMGFGRKAFGSTLDKIGAKFW